MFAEVNNNKIYYEVYGDSTNDPIFFIHGAPGLGDCENDKKAFKSLKDNYYLVFMDMRGSGRSEGNGEFTHEQWTKDIEILRLKLVNKPIIILGGSYGGFLTLEYVLRYPENVSKVILRDTAANNEFDHLSVNQALNSDRVNATEDEIRRLFEGNVHSNDELKSVFGALQPLYTVDFDEESVKEKLDQIYYRYKTHNFAFKYNKPKYDIVKHLSSIESPMLVTVGRHDWITPVECSEIIANEVPNATLKIFENSGHSPYLEENEEYLKVLRKFLNE